MPEPDVNDTVKIAADGTVAKTCPMRRLAKWWTPRHASRLFSRLVAAIGLIVGLGVVAWFSGEIVRCRWKTIQEPDTHGYLEMAKAFAQFQWPRWPDEFSRFRSHVWIDPAPVTFPTVAVTSENSPAAPATAVSAAAGTKTDAAAAAAKSETALVAAAPVPPPVMAKYSPGWPLLLVIGYWLNDARGMLWVNPILAMLGALTLFLIARELAGNVVAAICAFIWVTAPMTLMYTTYPLGHGPEITFTLLAVFFAMRWGRAAKVYWAFPAAFCTAFLPLIRPTTVLFWPAIALTYLVIRHETRSTATDAAAVADSATRTWRDLATGPLRWLQSFKLRRFPKWLLGPEGKPWLAAAAGAAVPLLFLAWYNYHSFGHFFRTGYYFTNEQKAFDLDWLIPGFNAWFGSTWSGGQGPQWIEWRWQAVWQERFFVLENSFLLLGVLGLLLRLRRPGMAWVFVLWLTPTLLLYVGYYFFMSGPVFYRFVLPAVPVFILSICFLFDGPVRRAAWLQLALLILFAFWVWHDPPRYFQRRAQVARGENRDKSKFPYGSPQARDALTGGLAQVQTAMRTADLEPWLRAGPTAVYAHGNRQWEVGEYLHVKAYDIDAWLDRSWSRPFNPNSVKMHGVWGDPNRGKRVHAEMTKLGPDGIKPLFESQLQAHLDAGRKVLLLVEDEHAVLGWARAHAGWQVDKVYERVVTPESERQGLDALVLWEVRMAPPAAEPDAGRDRPDTPAAARGGVSPTPIQATVSDAGAKAGTKEAEQGPEAGKAKE